MAILKEVRVHPRHEQQARVWYRAPQDPAFVLHINPFMSENEIQLVFDDHKERAKLEPQCH